jgi:5-methyltetrahydrofolate--homocysteine methyltransferase
MMFIDCLCITVSANPAAAEETLEAVKMIKDAFGIHCVLGISNISFGLPNRELVNRSFLALALENGVDLPIINPNSSAMTDTVYAFRLLRGFDKGCIEYIGKYSGAAAAEPIPESCRGDIFTAIGRELRGGGPIAKPCFRKIPSLKILTNTSLRAGCRRRALDMGEIFCQTVIRSADAAGRGL